MTAPFDEIPEKFVEYSKSQFTLYSTINTTICLYNSGEEECDPSVIGGKAVKIPSSGQLTVPSGTQYIYKLPSSVPSNLKFSFGKISARNVGFSGSSKSSDKISLKVTDNWINLLRIADVTLTITDNTDKIKIKDYVNHRAALEISSSSSSTKYAVNNSMEITLDEMKSFVDNTDADFDGKTLKLIDTNTIKDVEFTETDWIVTTTNGNTFTLPDYGMTLSIESASEYVTFDITNNAKTLRTLTYTCTDDASLYLTTRWTDTSVSVDSPINIRFTLAKNVKLLHPFAYLDEKIKKLFDLQILINECPYQNTSICVSTDGKSSCGLNGYFIQESFSNLYKVPTGYQFKVYIASDFNCKIGFDSSSAKNVSIIGYNGERSVILSHDSTTPSDILLTLDTVSLSLESSSSIDWKLGSLDIFDSTLSSSNIVKATISGNCSIEMDIFSKLIGSSGIFADGKLHVNGYMTLRDSNEEYLKEIKISETGWTLITSTVTFSVSSSLFKNLIFGVNKPPTSNTHFLPITAESSKISGNLNLNIEEENLYVTIGSDWKNVQSISGSKIYVTATHDKQVPSRFLYYDDSINYQNYFSIDTKRVHALNNATCDVCLLPSDDYANTCFMHERDMLPIITSNKNFLLDQERAYIIFGQSSDTYDFTYLTTKEYSVSVIAANKITVKMNNAPNNVNLHFDSLIDDDGLITLEFEKSMALNSLRFDDSVRISAPSGFKLTLGAMQVDYKSFRRFFREPGIFSTTDSIEINGELNIVDAIDESRYYAIELTSNGWKLIGNDDAWNTTFLRRGTKQTLKLTTLASTINVSAGEESNNYVNALSLMLTRQNTQVYFDSTINDVSSFYNNEKCKIETNSSATFYSSFSTPPSTMFEFKGQITQSYIQPTNTYSLCLYSGSTPCSITGTTPQKIDPSTPFRIKCAKSVSLILTVDASLLIGAESANTIILSGISQTDKKKATLSISEEAPKASLTLNNLVLQLSGDNLEFNSLTSTTSEINSNKNIVISDTLESDYVSLQKLNNIKLTVGKSIIINGNEAPTETGGPEISCESSLDTSVSLSNLGFFTVFALRPNSMTTQTSNEKTVWKFTNMPKDSTFTASYGNNKNIKLNWEGLETDVIPRLSLVLGTSSSVVVGGSHWPQTAKTGETVKISSSFNEISLDLKTPAALEYNNAKIAMHYDSLINLRQTNLLGNSQIGVLVDDDFENIVFGSKSIRLGEFELDRSMNKVGELSVIQNSDDFILQLSLDDSAISDKKIVDLTVQMMKGTKVEFSQGFSEIQSGKVTIDAIDAKIYVDDKVIPSVIDYNPSNVIIVINGKGGVSPGIIVLIVILVIAIVAAIVSLIVYFGFIRRRKLILDAYDNIPDLATDGANDKISMLAQNNEVL